MTANDIVDRIFESGPVDPDQFMSNFPDTYRELLDVFVRPFKRSKDYIGPEVDESAWRGVLIHADLYDDALHDRARRITDLGYTMLQGDLSDRDARLVCNLAFVNLRIPDSSTGITGSEKCKAIQKIWNFRYGDENGFERYLEGIGEARKQGPSPQGFVQTSGDFGSPWDYGGTWLNAETGDLIHFPGIELNHKDMETSSPSIDDKLLSADYNTILADVSLGELNKWEDTEDSIRQRICDQVTASLRFTYYLTGVETNEWIEKDWAKEIAEIKEEQEISDEEWASLTPGIKMDAIASRTGWEEFDSYPQKITKQELSVLLGVEL